ncbi:biotin/lipoyl-containing protein [Magnetococcus sp. PR-3]|uniref:biotin/lipoyl-containing protein n=1 Tax=Magnetococcus sp. PR-3 TaxID=3120355 RepID=UPI002FCE212C
MSVTLSLNYSSNPDHLPARVVYIPIHGQTNIAVGEVVVVVETANGVGEIRSQHKGVIEEICVDIGDELELGQALIFFSEDQEEDELDEEAALQQISSSETVLASSDTADQDLSEPLHANSLTGVRLYLSKVGFWLLLILPFFWAGFVLVWLGEEPWGFGQTPELLLTGGLLILFHILLEKTPLSPQSDYLGASLIAVVMMGVALGLGMASSTVGTWERDLVQWTLKMTGFEEHVLDYTPVEGIKPHDGKLLVAHRENKPGDRRYVHGVLCPSMAKAEILRKIIREYESKLRNPRQKQVAEATKLLQQADRLRCQIMDLAFWQKHGIKAGEHQTVHIVQLTNQGLSRIESNYGSGWLASAVLYSAEVKARYNKVVGTNGTTTSKAIPKPAVQVVTRPRPKPTDAEKAKGFIQKFTFPADSCTKPSIPSSRASIEKVGRLIDQYNSWVYCISKIPEHNLGAIKELIVNKLKGSWKSGDEKEGHRIVWRVPSSCQCSDQVLALFKKSDQRFNDKRRTLKNLKMRISTLQKAVFKREAGEQAEQNKRDRRAYREAERRAEEAYDEPSVWNDVNRMVQEAPWANQPQQQPNFNSPPVYMRKGLY